VLIKHGDLWDMAFIVDFPNLVLTSEQLARQILKFSEKTENRLIVTMLGGDSLNVGREMLKEHDIPSFDELDYTFRVMGRVLWQKFRVKAPGLL
jgi:acyl-CoA synthetase (NDP forming)